METNRKPLLLVVDDEPVYLHLLAEALSGDYRVKAATKGADAITIARDADKPDLILLDVIMPGLNGYEVCEMLKQDETTKAIPVIFVTGMGMPDGVARGLDLGAVDYIPKPINIAETKARIATHIKLKQLGDHLAKLSDQRIQGRMPS